MITLAPKGRFSALFAPKKASAEASDAEDVWRVVQARSGGFQVELPEHTREEVQYSSAANGNGPTIYNLSLERRGYYYRASCSDFGRSSYAARQALAQIDEELKRKEYRVLRHQEMYVLGEEGWMWEYIYRSSGTRCVRRAVCIEGRLYRMDVTFANNRSQDAIEYYSRFFDSMTLIPAAPRPATEVI